MVIVLIVNVIFVNYVIIINIILFYQMSFNQNEINQINNLSNRINERLAQFINIQINIEELINKIKSIKGNSSIYEKDPNIIKKMLFII